MLKEVNMDLLPEIYPDSKKPARIRLSRSNGNRYRCRKASRSFKRRSKKSPIRIRCAIRPSRTGTGKAHSSPFTVRRHLKPQKSRTWIHFTQQFLRPAQYFPHWTSRMKKTAGFCSNRFLKIYRHWFLCQMSFINSPEIVQIRRYF